MTLKKGVGVVMSVTTLSDAGCFVGVAVLVTSVLKKKVSCGCGHASHECVD